jgi:ribosomal protein L37AE/L43A
MIYEDHNGEDFKGCCPHCGSQGIMELPTRNRTSKWVCIDCEWLFGTSFKGKICGVFRDDTQTVSPEIRALIGKLAPEQKKNIRNLSHCGCPDITSLKTVEPERTGIE